MDCGRFQQIAQRPATIQRRVRNSAVYAKAEIEDPIERDKSYLEIIN